jgi:hypothetical protein
VELASDRKLEPAPVRQPIRISRSLPRSGGLYAFAAVVTPRGAPLHPWYRERGSVVHKSSGEVPAHPSVEATQNRATHPAEKPRYRIETTRNSGMLVVNAAAARSVWCEINVTGGQVKRCEILSRWG